MYLLRIKGENMDIFEQSKRLVRAGGLGLLLSIAAGPWMSGCTSVDEANVSQERVLTHPTLEQGQFVLDADQIKPEQLIKLTAAQQQLFLNWFNAEHRQGVLPHQRLSDFIEQYTFGFDYRGDTFTASMAMQYKAGNCLSLALLTSALAKLAGVEIGYQLINAQPVYFKRNDVLTLSSHVRTFLYDPSYQPAPDAITLRRPRLVIDYFPNRYDIAGRALQESELLAMYYRNHVSEALMANDLNKAFNLARQALQLSPRDAENINSLAVIYRRAGMLKQSEAFYQFGLELIDNNTNLVSNYAVMLEQEGRTSEAQDLRQKLLEFPDTNPYSWIKLGHEAYNNKQDHLAISYFDKALELAPYLDEVYFGMARSYYRQKLFGKAAKAMTRAAEKSWEEKQRQLYYAKLIALRTRSFKD